MKKPEIVVKTLSEKPNEQWDDLGAINLAKLATSYFILSILICIFILPLFSASNP